MVGQESMTCKPSSFIEGEGLLNNISVVFIGILQKKVY